MAVTTEQLLDGLQIPEERRLALWERAERMRIGVDYARATRQALADRRSQHGSGGPV
ncbi:hypothetical protein [Streptomyces chartreusis]|uniref:hypothetical protein n=1 Tax=Streptomyces chartreusis TaxID=1969 RepID=UPI003D709EEC